MSRLTRRQFLKLSATVFGGALLPPLRPAPMDIGRVTVPAVYVYTQPAFDSQRSGVRLRDRVLSIYERVLSEKGPQHNPVWYRVQGGFVHSGYVQPVEPRPVYPIEELIPKDGLLCEVSLPYTRAYHYASEEGWQPLYRLYYESIHRITGVEAGPDGSPWYQLTDDRLGMRYMVPTRAVRPIPSEEYSPIHQDVPADEKRIVVSISRQTLTAYEGKNPVYSTKISSGVHTEDVPDGEIPTDTPIGRFHIQLKMPARHMGDGNLTNDIDAYELPGVPWTMVFQKDGVALHGTYWHNNFGTRMSHGCVNMRNADAKWIFRWTDPVYEPTQYYTQGMGTLVIVEE